ncbi:hypothetical protein BDR05DRAFT_999359 [Suillus weaverae]|nr:hypothetical protein BDR05DRAFT_999359 [Suillus weaverae]
MNSLQELKDVMENTQHVNNVQAEKRKKKELNPGVDYLINADKCIGLMYRRKVFNMCFDNEAADFDHLDYDPEHIIGYSCCLISQPMICCNIHHPNHFSTYSSPTDELPATSWHSCIPKYKQKASDLVLLDALSDWCEEKTISIYGWAHLSDLDPSLILPNSTLDCIIDCAHHCKIHSMLKLKKETVWMNADRFGNEVVMLIQRLVPPGVSPFAMTPLSHSSSTANTNIPPPTPSMSSPCLVAITSNAPKCKNKCGACNQEGHNMHNCVCPSHPFYTGLNKENDVIGSSCPT